jgi:isopropylmalate/homocitrate/citramalate synthase
MKTFKGLIDLTFREGQQSPLMFSLPKYRFGLNEKKRIAKLLLKLGVRVFEFFSPVVNEMEALDFERLRDYIKSLSFNQARLLAHCRVNYHDVHAAIKTGFDLQIVLPGLMLESYSAGGIIPLIKQHGLNFLTRLTE